MASMTFGVWYEPLGPIETDWCDTCLLPSRLRLTAAVFVANRLHAVTTFSFCRGCRTS